MVKTSFFDEIERNKRKTWILIIIFVVIVAALGFAIGYIWNAPIIGIAIATIISLVMIMTAWSNGDQMILSMSKAKEVKKQEHPHLVNSVEGIAIAAGLPAPKVYMIDDTAINAFATGRDPQHASITVTKGAVDRLNREELEGVIAHEMGHIKNYDIRLMIFIVILIGSIVLLSDILLRSFIFSGGGRSRDREGGQAQVIIIVIALVLAILAPIIAHLTRMAISRKREYLADATGALLTRYPPGLANALKKIRDDKQPIVEAANKSTANLFIANPFSRKQMKSWMNRIFATHPPINDRIKRLEEM
ncbi:zinc metalloprotease HtpX [Nanoarchaeota archaeon]